MPSLPRCFFDDIACWGWPSQPRRRLLFASDIPRMPEPVPRALPPAIDRTVMAAIAELDDPAVRTGLQLLRATGMRLGELLDLELDCLVDFGRHGRWLRVPLGKLLTERMVPLDDDIVAVLDAWTALRGMTPETGAVVCVGMNRLADATSGRRVDAQRGHLRR